MGLFHKPIAELNLPRLEMLAQNTTIRDAVNFFATKKFGAVGITNESGVIAGILSERDLVLRLEPEQFRSFDEILVSSIMTKKVFSVDQDKLLVDALDLMARMEFRHLPIKVSESEYKMISARDILDLLIEHYRPVCEKLGTLTEWETQVGHVHEENYVFHGQKDTLQTGSFLFAAMKEVGGSDMLRVDQNLPVHELWGAMRASHLPVCAVVNWSTILCGIITERDLIYKVFTQEEIALEWPIHKIMTPNPHSMLLKHHLAYALNNMATFRYRNILVVDEDRFPIKITELIDFLKFFRFVLREANFEVE